MYARQRKDSAMEIWVAEIKLRAARRIGEISKALEKAQGKRSDIELSHTEMTKSKKQALAQAGLSKQVANRFEKIAEIPEDEFEQVIAKSKEKNKPITITQVESFCTIKH